MKGPLHRRVGADEPLSGSLRLRTLRALAWTTFQNLAIRGLSFVSFIVLARLLTPFDYGVASAAGVFVALFAMFAAAGVSQAIVQMPETDRRDMDAVFTFALSSSLILSGVMVAASWPASAFFDLPQLRAVMWALAPIFPAIAFSAAQAGLMQREFKFAILARVAIGANLVATIIGVILALNGAGYWSLVVQTIMVPIVSSGCIYFLTDYRPMLRLDRQRLAKVLGTGRQFMGENFLTYTNEQADKILVGRVAGAPSLGIYAVAFRMVSLLQEVMLKSARAVALSALSRIQHDSSRVHANYLTMMLLLTTVAFPVFTLLAVQATPIVTIAFGHKWIACVPYLQIFCIYAALHTVVTVNILCLQSIGSAKTAFRLSLVGTTAQIVFMLAMVSRGVEWVAAGFILRALIMLPLGLLAVSRRLKKPVLKDVVKVTMAPLISSAVMGSALFAVAMLPLGHWPLVAVGGAVSAVVYLGILLLIGRRHLREILTIRDAFSRAGQQPTHPS